MLAWLVASLHMVTIPYFIFHVTRKCWLKLIQEYITNVVFFDIKLILNMKREEQTFSLSCNYWTVKNRKLKGVKKIEHVQMINCCIYCCCFYFLGPWMSKNIRNIRPHCLKRSFYDVLYVSCAQKTRPSLVIYHF